MVEEHIKIYSKKHLQTSSPVKACALSRPPTNRMVISKTETCEPWQGEQEIEYVMRRSRTHKWFVNLYTRKCSCNFPARCACTYTHARAHTQTRTNMHTHTHTHTHKHTHTHTHTHTHKHAQTCTHTHEAGFTEITLVSDLCTRLVKTIHCSGLLAFSHTATTCLQ